MQLLGKSTSVNMNSDICYRVSSKSKICELNVNEVRRLTDLTSELFKEEKSVYGKEDLEKARERAKHKNLIRIKRLENQKRAGYALISSVTFSGILVMGLLIFMAIKLILNR